MAVNVCQLSLLKYMQHISKLQIFADSETGTFQPPKRKQTQLAACVTRHRYTPAEDEDGDVAVRGVSSDMFVPTDVDTSGTQATTGRLRATPAGSGWSHTPSFPVCRAFPPRRTV